MATHTTIPTIPVYVVEDVWDHDGSHIVAIYGTLARAKREAVAHFGLGRQRWSRTGNVWDIRGITDRGYHHRDRRAVITKHEVIG